MTEHVVDDRLTPYDLLGGAARLRAIVDRFYDLMDDDDRYLELRRLHAPDLQPMRRSLAGFLTAWLGGPRDWFAENPGKCMMSVHGAIAVDATTAAQWVAAMRTAIADAAIDGDLAERMGDALEAMAKAMVRADS